MVQSRPLGAPRAYPLEFQRMANLGKPGRTNHLVQRLRAIRQVLDLAAVQALDMVMVAPSDVGRLVPMHAIRGSKGTKDLGTIEGLHAAKNRGPIRGGLRRGQTIENLLDRQRGLGRPEKGEDRDPRPR